jgi:hypothetical protein
MGEVPFSLLLVVKAKARLHQLDDDERQLHHLSLRFKGFCLGIEPLHHQEWRLD